MRLTRLLVEVVRDRSRIRTRYRKKETVVVIDCYIETGFGNNLLPFAFVPLGVPYS